MNPIAFHFNGKAISKYSREELQKLESILEANSKKNFHLDNVELFTYDDSLADIKLISCCERLGLKLINLASPEMLFFLKKTYPINESYPSERFTLLFKILSLYHYIENNKVNSKYYYLLDQGDVYLIGNPQEKVDVLKDKRAHILYGAESRCMYWPMLFRNDVRYPDMNKYFVNYTDVKQFEKEIYGRDSFASNGHKTCFLNGGAVLGEVEYFMGFMKKYLPFIKEFINVNEQTMMHHFHFLYYPDIQIDHKCEVFQSMGPNKINLNLEEKNAVCWTI